MAKKKKPAANPARGFATTSLPSKPKPENTALPEPKATTKEVSLEPALNAQPSVERPPSPKAVALTPEELEAQLERDELQLLVEKHAPKVRRESNRQVVKIQTDRRVLRPQAESMTVHDWLLDEVLETILTLAKAESNDSNRRQAQQPLLKSMTEEDVIARLWALDLALRAIGFETAQIDAALQWLCTYASSISTSTSLWGFQEALEWLALNQPNGNSFSYNESGPKRVQPDSSDSSRPGTPITGALPVAHDEVNSKATDIGPPQAATKAAVDQSDVAVSDIDSDMEPDELVPTYLKVKAQLFELDPDSLDAKPRKKSGKGRDKAINLTNKTGSAAVRKLRSQLQKLESDALFDQYLADAQWPAKRNQIAQSRASQREAQSETIEDGDAAPARQNESSTEAGTDKVSVAASASPTADSDGEDADILGDMFSALPGESLPEASPDGGSITLRDFGKQTGVAPKRILEEAVRARDPSARLAFKMVSPTTYSCRHSLTITWPKVQSFDHDDTLPGVSCESTPSRTTFTAKTIATVSAEQSEGYIATVAMFSLFAPSAKEEKLYMRLAPNWRDFYKELLDHRKERLDAIDRESIQHFRNIVQDQLDKEDSDGVVLTNRFKMRNQAATSSNASESGRSTPIAVNENLIDIWKQKESTPSYQRMLTTRMTLPVFGFRDSILSTIDAHQVTIICGETGCGKSTQIPSFILEHQLAQGKPCKIYCTEPRRISAISLAQRVSDELGEGAKDLGTFRSLVGYAIRLETKASAHTRLIFATVGVVLRMLESSGRLEEVTHLIIDEVHERNIDTDFLLIILRSLMLARPELKVILMSATVDANRFSSYLNNAPILNVPGRTFPVQTKYLEDAIEFTHYDTTTNGNVSKDAETSDDEDIATKDKSGIPSKLPGYSSATRNALSTYDEYGIDYELIVRLIESVAFDPQLSHYSSAFLVFLPGIAEIRQLNDMLLGHPSFDKNWLLYPLHSTISSEDQQAAFLLPPPGVRKIVLATNIAETGVTIPDITCVIDTGKHKEMRFDERRQLSRLTQSFISRANAKQRRGRAGRVQEGLCFHLFTKFRHDTLMTDQQTPEMLRLSLQELVMRVKICKLGDIEETLSEALDPPSSRNIRRAIDALIEVDALTTGEDLTALGRQIARLPLDAHLSKLVLLSSMFGCVDAAITIAAILSSKSPFLTPFGAKQRADAARLAFKKGDSDLLTTYNAYVAWKATCNTAGRSEFQFCNKNFLSQQNLSNIEDLKAQLFSSLVEAGFLQLTPEERRALSRYRSTTRNRMFVAVPVRYTAHSNNDILVNSVVATAFYPKLLVREGKGWRNISNNQTVSLSPTSVNKITSINLSPAKYLSYYHIMQSTNKFYNAHSTSIVNSLPMILMVGSHDIDFKIHAGVVSLPGNVLRFAVRDWRAFVALKVLRRRMKEILAAAWKSPGRALSAREGEWMGLFVRVFVDRFEKEEKIRERAGMKGK